jgi:hypothetical protein
MADRIRAGVTSIQIPLLSSCGCIPHWNVFQKRHREALVAKAISPFSVDPKFQIASPDLRRDRNDYSSGFFICLRHLHAAQYLFA